MCRTSLVSTLRKLLYGSRLPSSGWTLIEVVSVSVIVGILAGAAMPSLLGMKARMDLKSGLAELKQALQQAQRNAIKMGKECKVQMNTTSNPPILTVASGSQYIGCLQSSVILNNVKLHENFPGTTIRFSYKGNSRNLGTMVVESPNASGSRYCLVMSNGIGMMRTGNYEAVPESDDDVDAAFCKTAI